MKSLFFIFISMFMLASAANAADHKRVSISKVLKALDADPEKALKDYALFSSRFAVSENVAQWGYKGTVKGKDRRVVSKRKFDVKKKHLFSCKLEKYKTDNGVEKVRIRITTLLK